MTGSPKLWDLIQNARVYDLSQPLDQKGPVSPNHPGFRLVLQRRHGDFVRADGASAASDLIIMGGHTGTHIDALCHVSHDGMLAGGVNACDAQRGGMFSVHGVETIPLLFCRGVLLDIPRLLNVDVLPPGMAITDQHLANAAEQQGLEMKQGDAVLIRSGWSRHWADPATYVGLIQGVPGPDESAATWLATNGARVTGAETIAYECIRPGAGHSLLPVHSLLLVQHGINIIECLNLSELATKEIWEFLFVLTPLRVTGGTGIPVRPVAVVQ